MNAEQERERRARAWRRDRIVSRSLFAAGALVGRGHLLEHLGVLTLYRPGVDDLVAGYPLAGLFVVLGAMRLPRY